MSDPERFVEDSGVGVRSGVKIELNAKQMPQPKISVYEGTTEDEMQRLLDLALRTFEIACRRLDLPVQVKPA